MFCVGRIKQVEATKKKKKKKKKQSFSGDLDLLGGFLDWLIWLNWLNFLQNQLCDNT